MKCAKFGTSQHCPLQYIWGEKSQRWDIYYTLMLFVSIALQADICLLVFWKGSNNSTYKMGMCPVLTSRFHYHGVLSSRNHPIQREHTIGVQEHAVTHANIRISYIQMPLLSQPLLECLQEWKPKTSVFPPLCPKACLWLAVVTS